MRGKVELAKLQLCAKMDRSGEAQYPSRLIYKGGLDGVTPGSSCIVNANTSNHELIASKETGAVKGFALYAVDAVGRVHARLLRVQALLLPVKTLVLSGH